jgi:predicted Na+-dependent transporter
MLNMLIYVTIGLVLFLLFCFVSWLADKLNNTLLEWIMIAILIILLWLPLGLGFLLAEWRKNHLIKQNKPIPFWVSLLTAN